MNGLRIAHDLYSDYVVVNQGQATFVPQVAQPDADLVLDDTVEEKPCERT